MARRIRTKGQLPGPGGAPATKATQAAKPDQPKKPPTLMEIALAHHNAGRLDQAIAAYNRILAEDPDRADVLNNLGVALRSGKRHEAAVAIYLRCLELDDKNAGAWSNLGNVFRDLGRFDEAVRCQTEAIELQPDSLTSAYNLGMALRDQRSLDESLEWLTKVSERRPDDADCHWDRALTLLYQENYTEGFEGYEWRLKLARASKRNFSEPRWDGSAIPGKTLLLSGEQGFGDMIQFARFIPLALERSQAAMVYVECRGPLMRLLSSVDGDFEVVAQDQPLPAFDQYLPLLSVPHVLGLGRDDLKADGGYLKPPAIHALRLPAPAKDHRRVGIAWAGKLTPRDRSAPLERFLDLTAIPGIEWYSLQIGERTSDIQRLTGGALIRDVTPKIDDFADTAAVIEQLDLVITIDTATAHLAGALGAKTWVLLTYVGDWRWLHEGEDCVWYPSIRLFRQPTPGDWSPVFAEVAAALRDWISQPSAK